MCCLCVVCAGLEGGLDVEESLEDGFGVGLDDLDNGLEVLLGNVVDNFDDFDWLTVRDVERNDLPDCAD